MNERRRKRTEVVLEVVSHDVSSGEGSSGSVGEVVGSRRSSVYDKDGVTVSSDVLGGRGWRRGRDDQPSSVFSPFSSQIPTSFRRGRGVELTKAPPESASAAVVPLMETTG